MALLPGSPCWACKGKVWWISVHGARVCNRCHPPATPSLVVVLVAIGTRAGKRIASVLTRPASGTPIRESDTPGIVQRLAPASRLLWTNSGSHPVAHHYGNPDMDSRARLFVQARDLEWPELTFGAREAVAAGAANWQLFCWRARPDQVSLAFAALAVCPRASRYRQRVRGKVAAEAPSMVRNTIRAATSLVCRRPQAM